MPPKPKPQLTHFLLLPLVTTSSRPQLQASLQRFAAEVTTPNNDSGEPALPAKAIRPVGAIHLTIGVMSLLTPERVDAACEFLKSLDVHGMLQAAALSTLQAKAVDSADSAASPPPPPPPTAVPESTNIPPTDAAPAPAPPPPPPLLTTLTCLHTLRAPTSSSTLYASTTPFSSPHLHPFALALRTAFTTASFLLPDPRPLTLHATLVNTIYARPRQSGKNRWGKGSGRFDASALMERYRGEVWARDVRVERVAICEMGAGDVLGEGGRVVDQVYREVASVGLP